MTSFALIPKGTPVEYPLPVEDERTQADDLLAIYESFAAMYPNPRLVEEQQERDRLLRAISAADQAVAVNPPTPTGNLWSRWFGGSNTKAPTAQDEPMRQVDDSRLRYVDDPEDDDDYLCGTQASLDLTCIPEEAHSLARFHLARRRLNTARRSSDDGPILVVVGPGELIEIDEYGQGAHQITSDREALAAVGPSFYAGYARAVAIGTNLLAISWGLDDGVVVFYRRRAPEGDCDWEAVAAVTADRAIQDNLADVFAEESGSAMLRVSDLVPIIVGTGDVPAATLAIARLGGYIELVPLPPSMWFGPPLQSFTRRRKGRRNDHYASSLANLAANPESGIVALTTKDYHADVISMACFTTSVQGDTAWDEEAYPNAPPSEHILAATGTLDGRQTVTFWSVSTIFPEDSSSAIGFTVHASIAEAIDLGQVGPDVSVFASEEIMKLWRKPRHVELAEESETTEATRQSVERVTAISVSAPIISISFVRSGDGNTYGALLDLNGGVTVMDCGLLERVVSQTLSDDEFELLYRNEDPDIPIPLAKIRLGRSDIVQLVADTNHTLSFRVTAVEWLRDALLDGECRKPVLALTTANPFGLRTLPIDPEETQLGMTAAVLQPGVHNLLPMPAQTLALLATTEVYNVDHPILTLSLLDTLEPRSILQALAHKGKFADIIQASTQLSSSELERVSDLVENAKKQLWHSNLDIGSLTSVADASFIVQEALSMNEDLLSEDLSDEFGLHVFRAVHDLALLRLRDVRLAQLIAIGGAGGKDAAERGLKDRLIRHGTYLLLSHHLDRSPSFTAFCSQFLPLSMIDLAKSFATDGDLAALTIIYFRHGRGQMDWLDVVSEIQLSVPPRWYHHLLPVPHNRGPSSRFVASGSLLDWAEMPGYVQEDFGLTLVTGAEDVNLVVEVLAEAIDSVDEYDDRAIVERWYLTRLHDIECFDSSLDSIGDFCRLGLVALGLADPMCAPDASHTVLQLLRYLRRVQVLNAVLSGKTSSDIATSRIAVIQLEDMAAMNAVDLVAVLLDGHTDSKDCLSHLGSSMLSDIADILGVSDQTEIDGAIYSYCSDVMKRSLSWSVDHKHGLLNAVATASHVTELSRSSLPKDKRLIKEPRIVAELVKTAVEVIVDSCTVQAPSKVNSLELVRRLWSMYESLPLRQLREPKERSQLADEVFESLVLIELSSNWPGCNGFDLLQEKNPQECFGRAVSNVCRSFRGLVANVPDAQRSLPAELLASFESDLRELCRLSRFESCSFGDLLISELLQPLLRSGHVTVLDNLLNDMDPSWFSRDAASDEIMAYVNEVVVAGSDSTMGSETQRTAVACRDVLQRHYPDLEDRLQSVWRSLDAAHFINNVLRPSSREWRPVELQQMSALDVIETILEEGPSLILRDSEEWIDVTWARDANHQLREASHFVSRDGTSTAKQRSLPPLPGRAVFYLAELLGLDSDTTAMAVKCRVIHYAVNCGFYGAAAAVCRSVFIDNTSWLTGKNGAPVLEALSQVLSASKYDDVTTKLELCVVFMQRFSADLSISDLDSFELVLSGGGRLEVSTSAAPKALRATERLCFDTMVEYSTDLSELFSILRSQAEESRPDDSLLNALSRFIVYWGIAQTTRPKPFRVTALERTAMQELVCLSSSLLLHAVDSDGASMSLVELRSILREQASSGRAAVPTTPANGLKADPGIVRRLVGRGYSENGASRAAIATNNASFDEAVQWAVMHTLESGFDDPVVVLKSPNPLCIDEEGIQQLENCLELTAQLLDTNMVSQLQMAALGTSMPSEEQNAESYPPDEANGERPASLAETEEIGSIHKEGNGQYSSGSLKRTKLDSNGWGDVGQSLSAEGAPLALSAKQHLSLDDTDQHMPNADRKQPRNEPTINAATLKSDTRATAPESESIALGSTIGAEPKKLEKITPPTEVMALETSASLSSTKAETLGNHHPFAENTTAIGEAESNALAAHHQPTVNPVPPPPSSNAIPSNQLTTCKENVAAAGDEGEANRAHSTAVSTVATPVAPVAKAPPTAATRPRRPLTTTPKPPPPPPPRSTLKERGQSLFQTARTAGSPSSEDRRRLIEAGRRLLQQARTTGPSKPASTYSAAPLRTSARPPPKAEPPQPKQPALTKDGWDDFEADSGWDFED